MPAYVSSLLLAALGADPPFVVSADVDPYVFAAHHVILSHCHVTVQPDGQI